MKPRAFSWIDVLLLLAAAGGLAFFMIQHRSAGTLAAENARLSERIEAREKRGELAGEEGEMGLSAKSLVRISGLSFVASAEKDLEFRIFFSPHPSGMARRGCLPC